MPPVGERVAQTVAKRALEPQLEPHFDHASYGYRPGKAAKGAGAGTRQRGGQSEWVVEFESKGAFDTLDHGLLLKAGRKHPDWRGGLRYVARGVRALTITAAGEGQARQRGTPPGGVLGPLWRNLFLPYAVAGGLRGERPMGPLARYADDGGGHGRTERQAQAGKQRRATRWREGGLELHPDKTRSVYGKDSNRGADYPTSQVTFRGVTFRPRRAQHRVGERLTSFLPGASRAAQQRMRQQLAPWHRPRQTPESLRALSTPSSAIVAGWGQYYGSFSPPEGWNVVRHVDLTLAWGARRKYKTLRGQKRRSRRWLAKVSRREAELFVHWQLWYGTAR